MRPATIVRVRARAAAAVTLALLLAAGCGGDAPTGPVVGGTSAAQVIGTKLAALAIEIATASEGGGPFDNFIGCTRRGVIDYTNTPTGRRATVTGCNLGDSVVVDGDVELRWVAAGGNRADRRRIELVGPLTVRVGDTTRVVENAVVENVTFTTGQLPSLITANVDQARVQLLGTTVTPDERGRATQVFGAFGLGVGSIPNPAGTPQGLAPEDARRIALQLGTFFLAVLFDESGRPPHEHVLPCGRIVVTTDAANETNRITFEVNQCDFGRELLVSGNFALAEANAVVTPESARIVLTGPMTLGGGVARTSVTAFEWEILLPPGGAAGNATVTLTLVAGQDRWEYTYVVPIDD